MGRFARAGGGNTASAHGELGVWWRRARGADTGIPSSVALVALLFASDLGLNKKKYNDNDNGDGDSGNSNSRDYHRGVDTRLVVKYNKPRPSPTARTHLEGLTPSAGNRTRREHNSKREGQHEHRH